MSIIVDCTSHFSVGGTSFLSATSMSLSPVHMEKLVKMVSCVEAYLQCLYSNVKWFVQMQKVMEMKTSGNASSSVLVK